MAEISKKRTWIWVAVIGAILIGGGVPGGILLYRSLNAPESVEVVNITVHEAKAMIDDNATYPNLIVLDIRLDYEYTAGHLNESEWIPWNGALGSFEGGESALSGNETTEIIVYCNSGTRSAGGSQFLVDAGFTIIFNMIGGITEWLNQGYPTTTT